MTELAIKTEGLTKVYGGRPWTFNKSKREITAVSDVTFEVEKGELFGLLGPNGAGKTTLIKMLCTLILPSSGHAKIAGVDLSNDRAVRACTGLVVSDERSFYWRLSLEQNMAFFAALQGLHGARANERTDAVLRAVNLEDRRHQRFSDLSSGMRQRLAIARALLHLPEVLILDEPTRSLDPTVTAHIHQLMNDLQRDQDLSILLITHDLNEAEKMCQRIGLMHEGRIQAIGSPHDLRRQLRPQRHYQIMLDALPIEVKREISRTLKHYGRNPLILEGGGGVRLDFSTAEDDGILTAVLAILNRHKLSVKAIEGAPATLEEVFTHFTGKTENTEL